MNNLRDMSKIANQVLSEDLSLSKKLYLSLQLAKYLKKKKDMKWIRCEIKGIFKESEIPDYRIMYLPEINYLNIPTQTVIETFVSLPINEIERFIGETERSTGIARLDIVMSRGTFADGFHLVNEDNKKVLFGKNSINKLFSEIDARIIDFITDCITILHKTKENDFNEEEIKIYYLFGPEIQIDDYYFRKLINECNMCYNVGAYSACLVMVRKLFETLLVEILKKKYGTEGHKTHLYWNSRYKSFNMLRVLIENLESNINDFLIYSNHIGETLTFLKKNLKKECNKAAHSIDFLVNHKKLDGMREEINHHLILLIDRVLKEI